MTPEGKIEAHLVKRVKALNGEIRKVSWINRAGAPDRLVLFKGHRPILVELKAPGKKATAQQLREHERLREWFDVFVIDSKEGVERWF